MCARVRNTLILTKGEGQHQRETHDFWMGHCRVIRLVQKNSKNLCVKFILSKLSIFIRLDWNFVQFFHSNADRSDEIRHFLDISGYWIDINGSCSCVQHCFVCWLLTHFACHLVHMKEKTCWHLIIHRNWTCYLWKWYPSKYWSQKHWQMVRHRTILVFYIEQTHATTPKRMKDDIPIALYNWTVYK
jgi:hypothetical protein